MIRVLLLSDLSREPERQLLKGLVQYANSHGGCALFPVSTSLLEDSEYVDEIISRARNLKINVIFGKWPGIDEEKVKKIGIPVFLRTHKKYYSNFSMLTGEHRNIGRLAADFFIDKKFNSFAFYGLKDLLWCEERLQGFEERIQQIPGAQISHLFAENTENDRNEVKQWLHSLKKPVGLVTGNDVMAYAISELCQEDNIGIPEEISLLGIDDDEFLCNISQPKLSSIHLDFGKQGEELAKAMIDMVDSKTVYPVRIPIRASKIVERDSTLNYNIKDVHIQKIVKYLEMNYSDTIDIDKLVGIVPLTRRSVEMRFKKEMAPYTILSFLTHIRVKQMCLLLRETDLPISLVAEKCGFFDTLNVGRTFRKIIGQSPRAYRASNQDKALSRN